MARKHSIVNPIKKIPHHKIRSQRFSSLKNLSLAEFTVLERTKKTTEAKQREEFFQKILFQL